MVSLTTHRVVVPVATPWGGYHDNKAASVPSSLPVSLGRAAALPACALGLAFRFGRLLVGCFQKCSIPEDPGVGGWHPESVLVTVPSCSPS